MNIKKMSDLSEKVVFLTGAAGILGTQYATALSNAGANVVLADINYTRCKKMEINIPIEKLQKKSLFIATPMYGGQCAGIYTKSSNDLSALAMHYKVNLKFYYLFNESLVTRARNYCVDEFMRSDCTHMMFIDSDIGFNPNDVITMLAMQDEENEECPYDILCGPYPKKCISWEKIAAAVNKGAADEDPEVLSKFVGDYVLNCD